MNEPENLSLTADGNTPLLPDDEMRALGFTDRSPERWYFCERLIPNTTMNFTINKATGDYSELVMDEDFGQPAYYGRMKPEWRDRVQAGIDEITTRMKVAGLDLTVNPEEYGYATQGVK